ncbi:MAG TPA: hypothetical protein VFU76_02370 [Terriglobales bacterium]|nr:hypothetical protein [Terriglobales bacterium]
MTAAGTLLFWLAAAIAAGHVAALNPWFRLIPVAAWIALYFLVVVLLFRAERSLVAVPRSLSLAMLSLLVMAIFALDTAALVALIFSRG